MFFKEEKNNNENFILNNKNDFISNDLKTSNLIQSIKSFNLNIKNEFNLKSGEFFFISFDEIIYLIIETLKFHLKLIENDSKNYENILQNFEFILNNSMTNKLSQISFRLISNLLVVCNNDLNNEYLETKFIENFFEKKSVILYINDILNSPKNKYDISFVKDVLLLIFNLICISPVKSSIFFKKGIVNLISDRDYQINKDIMKLLFMIFYRILASNYFSFEKNDEKVIKSCLTLIKKFKNTYE